MTEDRSTSVVEKLTQSERWECAASLRHFLEHVAASTSWTHKRGVMFCCRGQL